MKFLPVFLLTLLTGCATFPPRVSPPPLPPDVSHTVQPGGLHRYVFHNAYTDAAFVTTTEALAAFPRDLAESGSLDPATTVTLDAPHREVAITTKTEIRDMRQFCDETARAWGVLPYWDELVARRDRSPQYDPGLYEKAAATDDVGLERHNRVFEHPYFSKLWQLDATTVLIELACPPAGGTTRDGALIHIAVTATGGWYDLKTNPLPVPARVPAPARSLDEFRVPLRYGANVPGTLRLNKATAACMCHNWYSMRVYNAEGHYVWEMPVAGDLLCPVVADVDHDGTDEILLFTAERICILRSKAAPARIHPSPAVAVPRGPGAPPPKISP